MKYCMPINKIERRELEVKECNVDTGFILYNFHIPQAVDINIDITPDEIEWLYETNKKLKKKLLSKE